VSTWPRRASPSRSAESAGTSGRSTGSQSCETADSTNIVSFTSIPLRKGKHKTNTHLNPQGKLNESASSRSPR
jgi:hypothetical protein